MNKKSVFFFYFLLVASIVTGSFGASHSDRLSIDQKIHSADCADLAVHHCDALHIFNLLSCFFADGFAWQSKQIIEIFALSSIIFQFYKFFIFQKARAPPIFNFSKFIS
ncbi:MAG: hypothetical protein KDK38_09975 [Leptospiraceae bacterium]|nr:hypothetical protein [Leptospiraceae bacterium]